MIEVLQYTKVSIFKVYCKKVLLIPLSPTMVLIFTSSTILFTYVVTIADM